MFVAEKSAYDDFKDLCDLLDGEIPVIKWDLFINYYVINRDFNKSNYRNSKDLHQTHNDILHRLESLRGTEECYVSAGEVFEVFFKEK